MDELKGAKRNLDEACSENPDPLYYMFITIKELHDAQVIWIWRDLETLGWVIHERKPLSSTDTALIREVVEHLHGAETINLKTGESRFFVPNSSSACYVLCELGFDDEERFRDLLRKLIMSARFSRLLKEDEKL